MRSAIAILLLCVSGVLQAADGGPADLALVGVDSAKVGESVRLRLDGLPAVDLAKTMSEQLAWMSQVRIITAAPKGITQSDFALDQQLSIKVSPFQWTFALDFTAKKPGDYVVIVDWNEAPYGLVHHRISVLGGTPTDPLSPSDPSQPSNPQNPSKISQVTWVWEKDNGPVPKHVASALQRINAERSGIVASEFEDDTVDGDGQVPDQYKQALEASKTAGVPVLVFQSGSVVVKTIKDPKTEAEIMEVLK